MNGRAVLSTAKKAGRSIPYVAGIAPLQGHNTWRQSKREDNPAQSNAGKAHLAGNEILGHSFSRIAPTDVSRSGFERHPYSAGSGLVRQFEGGGPDSADTAESTAPAMAQETEAAPAPAGAPSVEDAGTPNSGEAPEAEAEAQPALSWEHQKRSTNDALWWFNGEHPRWFSTTAKLAATGYGDANNLHWRIVKGADKVAFTGAPTGAEATVRSTAGSKRADDVEVEVSEGPAAAAATYSGKLTVRMPYRLIQRSASDTGTLTGLSAPTGAVGWWTTFNYRIVDNVGGTIVGATVNENFPGSKTDDQKNDWPGSASFSTNPTWPNTNGTFLDSWYIYSTSGGTPAPVAPTAANANQSVDKMTHEFYVGSQTPGLGVRVQKHTAHRYRGYARHENITTPAP